MQLKFRMDEESAEAKQERLLNEQFEKEEWKKLRKHIIDSDDSKNLMQAIIEVKDEFKMESDEIEKYNTEKYMSLITAGINEVKELPYINPEAKPFLCNLQKSSETLNTLLGELFQRQQVIPFIFLNEFFTKYTRENVIKVLKSLSAHVCRGIFALNSDRLYSSERNPNQLRNARNNLLKLLRDIPPLKEIPREEIDKKMNCPIPIITRVLEDVGESENNQWRLKFSEYGLDDFEEAISDYPLLSKTMTDIQENEPKKKFQKGIEEGTEGFERVELEMIEELKNEGVMTYMQLLNIAKQKVSSEMYSKLDPMLERIIGTNAVTIKNVVVYAKASDPSTQEVGVD